MRFREFSNPKRFRNVKRTFNQVYMQHRESLFESEMLSKRETDLQPSLHAT